MNDRKIRILYVDDDIAGAAFMRLVLEMEPDMLLVGSLSRADNLEQEIQRTEPDVVLLDMSLPGRDPIEALRSAVSMSPTSRIVVFSGRDDEDLVERVKQAGAWGYLSKGRSSDEVLDTIRRAAGADTGP